MGAQSHCAGQLGAPGVHVVLSLLSRAFLSGWGQSSDDGVRVCVKCIFSVRAFLWVAHVFVKTITSLE